MKYVKKFEDSNLNESENLNESLGQDIYGMYKSLPAKQQEAFFDMLGDYMQIDMDIKKLQDIWKKR